MIPDSITDSKFATFRAMIALGYADHVLTDEEKQVLNSIADGVPLTAGQRRRLDEDIDKGIRLDDVIADITEIRDRAHLINIARVIFFADGKFCDSEQEIYERIKSSHTSALNIEKELENAAASARKSAQEWDMKRKMEEKNRPLLERISFYITDFFWRD